MKNPNKLQPRMTGAITAVVSLGAFLAGTAGAAEPLVFCKEQERCYGVAKAGKNDCATATSACAGTTRQDFQKDAWVYVPKGSCVKLAGGLLTPAAGAALKKP